MAEQKHTALVLSAGAPHSPLMAGFLSAIYEKGKAFKFIYTSGAGVLIGLLYAAPKDKTPDKALREIVELGIHDWIYRLCPINYKVFHKPGPFTRPMQRLAQHFKLGKLPLEPIPEPGTAMDKLYNEWIQTRLRARRFYNDLVDFWAAALTPTTLNYWSKGLCEPLPFLEELVDFGKLQGFDEHFCLNVFDVSAKDMKVFEKKEIKPAHVRAAFAHPFIYKPVRIDDKVYFEGADREPICFRNLLTPEMRKRIDTIVLLDILGGLEPTLLREPRDLPDAFAMSILLPVIGLAKQEVKYFKEVQNMENGQEIYTFREIDFAIPEDLKPHITEWSYSNLEQMWEIGHKRGLKFVNEDVVGQELPERKP